MIGISDLWQEHTYVITIEYKNVIIACNTIQNTFEQFLYIWYSTFSILFNSSFDNKIFAI